MKKDKKSRRKTEPVQTTKVSPAAMREAERIAKKIGGRVVVQSDGSIIVKNK